MNKWFVYIVECFDGTFYTGITNDLEKRMALHNSGKGARYTRGRGPVNLKYSEKMIGKSEALKREIIIKNMTRKQKMALFR